MPDQGAKAINTKKLAAVGSLVQQLNLVLTELLSASRATAVPAKLMQIANEMSAIQTLINQAAQAQAAANDGIFASATTSLKTQAQMLQGVEAHIAGIVTDAEAVGRITGYVLQALAQIAKL
jgi:hypothetical protein